MPLAITTPDPTGTAPIEGAYCYLAFLAMDFAGKRARFEYHLHRDEAAAYAGKAPVGAISIHVGPEPSVDELGDAVPSFDQLIADNADAYTDLATAAYALPLTMPARFPGAVLIVPE